jgi:sugar phosphate isomerase/epimerase
MDRLAIEFISVLGMPPVEYVELTARLGVTKLGFAPAPIAANPLGYPAWDLRTDPALLRATKAALAANGVSVALGEGFLMMQGLEIADSKPIMDIMAELGAPMVNAITMEQDRARAHDQFALYAEMAAERGMLAALEFMPMMWPLNIHEAAALVTESGAANGRVLVDAMHFFRGGSQVSDLAQIDPALIGHIQICDVPMPAKIAEYGMEARDNRLPLGEGDLPLAQFLNSLPGTLNVGIEMPLVARAEAGENIEDLLRQSVATSRGLLA